MGQSTGSDIDIIMTSLQSFDTLENLNYNPYAVNPFNELMDKDTNAKSNKVLQKAKEAEQSGSASGSGSDNLPVELTSEGDLTVNMGGF